MPARLEGFLRRFRRAWHVFSSSYEAGEDTIVRTRGYGIEAASSGA